jgi:hypothetical protein
MASAPTSHNFGNENISQTHQTILDACWDDNDKEMLTALFTITDHLHPHYTLIERDLTNVLLSLKDHLKEIQKQNEQQGFKTTRLDFQMPDFKVGVKLAAGRSERRMLIEAGLDYKLGGRKSRIEDLLFYLSRAPFTEEWYDRCELLEEKYARSTVMKALKILVTH